LKARENVIRDMLLLKICNLMDNSDIKTETYNLIIFYRDLKILNRLSTQIVSKISHSYEVQFVELLKDFTARKGINTHLIINYDSASMIFDLISERNFPLFFSRFSKLITSAVEKHENIEALIREIAPDCIFETFFCYT
ncbi:MAG: hypothetical protein MHPSP_002544, partial [Paramarteilia canceri]